MDKLIIRNLQFYAAIGVTEAERRVGQRLLVDAEVAYDLSRAGRSDALEDTISYSDLARLIEEMGTTIECRLLEHMAEQIASAILEHFPVEHVRLRLLKAPPPVDLPMEAAGVELIRHREQG